MMSGSNGIQLAATSTFAIGFVQVFTAIIVLCTLLPFIRTGWWFVRVCDFPRLQLSILCGITLFALFAAALITGWSTSFAAYAVVLIACLLWQAWHVIEYTKLWPMAVPHSDDSKLRLFVSNLDYQNTESWEVEVTISKISPQLLLLIEINERWKYELRAVREVYPHRVEAIQENGLAVAAL